jgi:glycosyltransferase involved in cell wall biosynthesis
LAEDDQKLKEYQSLARQRVVDSFSIEVMVNALEKLYLEQII